MHPFHSFCCKERPAAWNFFAQNKLKQRNNKEVEKKEKGKFNVRSKESFS
jgi:hypothetical protein